MFWTGLIVLLVSLAALAWLFGFIPGPSIRLGESGGFGLIFGAAICALVGAGLMVASAF